MSSSRGMLMPITTTCSATGPACRAAHQHGEQDLLGLPRSPVEAVEDAPWGTLSKKAMGRG